jgi:peptidyl-prolyl cis-trans isomerase B (cyclophilin B)
MARSADPDSAGSQFFIVHKDANFLDEQYTVFGRLVTHPSYDTLDAIANMETSSKDVPIEFDDTKIFKSSIITRAELDDQCK